MPPKMKQELLTEILPQRKKRDRFNGKTEEEVLEMKLPDHLQPNLDIIIIGINPGLTAAHIGHHYAGPGNHFWKCLYLSGLIPEPMNAYDDARLMEFGIGFTNIVERTSRGSADLTRKEIKMGAEILQAKIARYQPKIAVFNGKGIYEVFCGHKKFFIGKQPDPFPGTNTVVFVMPSSSARCSQLPRAIDKVPFYAALKKLRDYLNGHITGAVLESDFTFPDLELKVEPKKEVKVEGDIGGNGVIGDGDGGGSGGGVVGGHENKRNKKKNNNNNNNNNNYNKVNNKNLDYNIDYNKNSDDVNNGADLVTVKKLRKTPVKNNSKNRWSKNKTFDDKMNGEEIDCNDNDNNNDNNNNNNNNDNNNNNNNDNNNDNNNNDNNDNDNNDNKNDDCDIRNGNHDNGLYPMHTSSNVMEIQNKIINNNNNNNIKSEPSSSSPPPPSSSDHHHYHHNHHNHHHHHHHHHNPHWMYNIGVPYQYHSDTSIKQEVITDGYGCHGYDDGGGYHGYDDGGGYHGYDDGRLRNHDDVTASSHPMQENFQYNLNVPQSLEFLRPSQLPQQPQPQLVSAIDLSIFKFDRNRCGEKFKFNNKLEDCNTDAHDDDDVDVDVDVDDDVDSTVVVDGGVDT